jgi:hypothetical protein
VMNVLIIIAYVAVLTGLFALWLNMDAVFG